jgi:hypothetical protein
MTGAGWCVGGSNRQLPRPIREVFGAYRAVEWGGGSQTERIGMDRISERGRGRSSRRTLKVDGMERKGHVDAQMSGVRHASEWVGASPGHNDATPSGAARWICDTGAAGEGVVMTVKCSPGEGERGRACQGGALGSLHGEG